MSLVTGISALATRLGQDIKQIKTDLLAATALAGTKLSKADNLSDLADVPTARTNLALGSAALKVEGFFARATQAVYLNVKDFGAVGNGTADDTAAIQAAITACASGGGTVYLPAGQYKTTAQINIPYNGVQLLGDGSQATMIRPATAGQNVFAMEKPLNASIEYCSIRHMRIEPSALVNRCIIINNHYWCMIEDVVFAGSHNAGIEVYRGSVAYNLVLKDVLVNTSTDTGCILGQQGTGELQNVIMLNACFNGSAGRGLAVFSCGGLLWTNGECLGCNVGFYVRPASTTEWVKGMYINNVFFDTSASDTVQLFLGTNSINKINYCTFTNCSFNAATAGHGVNIGGAVAGIDKITNIAFIGCHFTINGKSGLRVDYAKRIDITACYFISNNIVNGAGDHGISLDHVDSVRVIGGSSGPTQEFPTNRQKYGVSIGSAATNVLVNGMDVRGNVTGGVLDGTKVSIVRDCVGHKTFNRGIGSIGSGASSVVINHGLAIAPPDVFVLVQALTNPGTVGGGQLYASNITATQFTVSTSTAISGGTMYFYWQIASETGTV